jgi:HD-like signal output (HDOD) protein
MARCSPDYALVCGLLHDIGQLLMARCYPLEFQMVRQSMECDETLDLLEAERQHFGVDHCTIGAILATAWHLPASVIAAIQHHHEPDPPADKLVAATHVGEVIANALDLARYDEARVICLSENACNLLGIDWNGNLNYLFGKIEARTRQLCRIFG